jgi:multidrug efflux system membrane fusion protein
MATGIQTKSHKRLGRALRIAIVASAGIAGLIVLYQTNYHPRTDDAEVLANFIGIAPQIEGPITRLNVRDNQFVKKGELLFEIDDRPYRYTLERTLSEQATLEGQIVDQRRTIAAQVSAVSVSEANIQTAQTDVTRFSAAVDEARADVANSEQGVIRARADWTYANNNLHRIEPLLAKQFVTVDQVDKARSVEIAQA